ALLCVASPAIAESGAETAADFRAMTLDGKEIVLSADFRGKLILMDFWATWCVPCMEEVPGLVAAYKQFANRGVAFLGVTLDSPPNRKEVLRVMKEQGMVWPQIFDDDSDVGGQKITVAYKVEGIPAPFLINGDTGEIIARDSMLRGSRLQKTLETALKNR
ncbi:MAG: TlpA disulfide reductase family protein, partial [Spirochaetaceae bacterium]|nr:TlpA disulfide reductase family protein [Spirochaetaceae bacterium]